MEKAPWSKSYIYIYVIYKNNDACNSKACTCIYERNFIWNIMRINTSYLMKIYNIYIYIYERIEGEYPY